jgi:hypothetical protein
MAKFEEVASGSCPVLHAPRKDGAVLIATRVPLGDVRLQKWGWILAVSNLNNPTEDDIETLTDNSGKRYPKVYYFNEVQNYAERWGCSEWQEGYQDDGNGAFLSKSNGVAGSELVRVDAFQQALGQLQTHQQERLGDFQNQVLTQVAIIRDEVRTNGAKLTEELEGITSNSNSKLLEQLRPPFEDTRRQMSLVNDEITRFRQVQEAVLDGVALQSTKKDVEAVENSVQGSLSQVLTDVSTQIKDVQDSLGKIWDAVNPTLDLDTDSTKTENTDIASSAANAARKATSRIERMAANLTGLSSSYYKNVNEQSKRSFDLARMVSFIGGMILAVSLIAVFITLFFHFGELTLILNGIGTFIAAIVEAIAGLNLLYDKATKQFSRSQVYLDRIQRSSMAYAIAENMQDEAHKQQIIEKIALDLVGGSVQMHEKEKAH